jgi:hypothetical protein
MGLETISFIPAFLAFSYYLAFESPVTATITGTFISISLLESI